MDRDTRDMLLETADRFFTQRCGRDVVNGVEKGAWPADFWKEIEEMGLPLIAVPEDKGGQPQTFPLGIMQFPAMDGGACNECKTSGIGASFDTPEHDVQIAQAGLAALSR